MVVTMPDLRIVVLIWGAYMMANICFAYNSQQLTHQEQAELMTIGTRVTRGDDWSWEGLNCPPPTNGSVESEVGKDGWVHVKWDKTGTSCKYRMGSDGKYDLKLVPDVNNTCGGDLRGLEGLFASPGYPTSYYDSDLNCRWLIKVPTGKKVVLSFLRFDTERCDDYVTIHDGDNANAPRLVKLCGRLNNIEKTISSGENMHIDFSSDWASNRNYGFLAHWSTLEVDDNSCHGHFKEPRGQLTSPGYPKAYPNNAACGWRITVPEGHHVVFSYTHFFLESPRSTDHGLTCTDKVKMYDGADKTATQLRLLCGGNLINRTVVSSGRDMFIQFETDSTNTYTGFHGLWTAAADGFNACGGDLTGTNGSFASPGYPKDYPNYVHCVWRIKVQPGKKVKLTLLDFDVESYSLCSQDDLTIRDGGDDKAPILGKLCGELEDINNTIVSSGSQMYITFKSDFLRRFGGFLAEWTGVDTGCVDQSKFCKYNIDCDDTEKSLCPVKCGSCPTTKAARTTQACVDKSTDCSSLASVCDSDVMVSSVCPVTCGSCPTHKRNPTDRTIPTMTPRWDSVNNAMHNRGSTHEDP